MHASSSKLICPIAAHLAASGMVDYAASKSAALALHEGLQSELRTIYNAPRVRATVVCPSIVSTEMFTGLVSPSNFVAPVLRPEEVAKAVVEALWAGEARHIDMPWSSKVMAMSMKALPSFFRVMIQDGAAQSMRSFRGRQILE